MNASLDTDIVIHLYISEKKDLLFSTFKELYMYEYLTEKELKNKAPLVYEELKIDTEGHYTSVIICIVFIFF